MQKQIRRALALVLVSALFADAQTTGPRWGNNKSYKTLGAEGIITPEEIMKAGLAVYTEEEIRLLFKNLPSPSLFNIPGQIALNEMRKNGYVLVPVPPSAISKSTELWLAIRFEAIPDSFNENRGEQFKRADGPYKRVPMAEEVIWWVQVLWVTRHKLPFHHVYIRTASPSFDGGHVCLGGNEAGILKIRNCPDDLRSFDIGLAPVAIRP